MPTVDELSHKVDQLQAKIDAIARLFTDAAGAISHAPESKPVLFESYTESWLMRYKAGKRKPTTLSGYETALKKHLYPAFGAMDIRSITIDHIQDFLTSKSGSYVEKTIEGLLVKLRSILDAAVEDGIIPKNPAKSARLAIASQKSLPRKDALTEARVADIIARLPYLDETARLYVAIPLFTGIRKGELLGLRWDDIDFGQNLIHIRRNVTYPRTNDGHVGTPKTKDGVREIPIHPVLRQHLGCPPGENAFVIGGGTEPIKDRANRALWARISDALDLRGKGLHCFRHTFVTLLTREGVSESTLQRIGGYSDLRTMRKTYTHTQQQDLDKAAEQMKAAFPPFS